MDYMNELIFMQGVPGSGKSTIAASIAARQGNVLVLSTDNYWYREDGVTYQFDATKLNEAHQWNQRLCAHWMDDGFYSLLIIDNTNITRAALKPYLALCEIFGYTWSAVRVDTPLETCIKRQKNRPADRQVPEEVIRRMHSQMETLTSEQSNQENPLSPLRAPDTLLGPRKSLPLTVATLGPESSEEPQSS